MGHFQPTSASARWSGFWLFSAWPAFPWASLKLKQRQLPIQRLILIFFIEATTVLDIITTVATLTTATTARDLLTLSLPLLLMPRLKLIPGMDTMDTDTVLDTMVDTMVDTMATPTTATMARGLLMPRLPLLLTPRLTPTWCIAITVLVATTVATMTATPTMATTARDLPTLSPLLPPLLMPRLIPGTDTTVDLHTTVTATHTTDMATATATTGASKKGTSRAGEHEVPTFLTTTCLMFSTSEKNQNVQKKTSSFFKHTAFKHLYILDFGIFACIPVTTFRTSRKNEKCVVLMSDFIQRLRIKCKCLTKQSFNI